MDIRYTFHAKQKIEGRKLEKVWIEETIKYPDYTKREGRKYYVTKKLNGMTLRVVYTKENYINIITLYWIK